MADPVAPAVASFDPVEWTRRINALEEGNNQLASENRTLKQDAKRLVSDAAGARGELKSLKAELARLRDLVEKSDNLKELARLRVEVAALHKSIAETSKAQAIADTEAKQKLAVLSARASKAESQFKSLESTASILATTRDRATLAAEKLLAERDAALAKASAAEMDLRTTQNELRELRASEQKAQKAQKAVAEKPA